MANKDVFNKVLLKIKELRKREENVFLDENKFFSIKKNELSEIAFIDGSNFNILSSSDFSLSFFRIIALVIDGKNKKIIKREFFAFINIKNEFYNVEIFPLNHNSGFFEGFSSFRFSINDKNLRIGNEKVEIKKIEDCIRRLAEIRIAKELKTKVIVLDGSLDAKFDYEKLYLDELYKEKEVYALSKQNNIIVKGISLTTLLRKKGEGYYDSGLKSYKARIYFIKLNEKSDYVFRLDANASIDRVLYFLKQDSRDISFLGYPYSFVKVHQNAVIKKYEKEYFLTKLMVMAGKDWEFIEKKLKDVNAHSVLDQL